MTETRSHEPVASLLVDLWLHLDQPEIGVAVGLLRQRLGSRAALIQRMWDLSRDAELGVDESLVFRWEKGNPRPRPSPRYRVLLGKVCESEVQTMDSMNRREFVRALATLVGPALSLGLLSLDDLGTAAGVLEPWTGPASGGLELDDDDPIGYLRRLRAVLVESDNLLGPRHVISTVERHIAAIQRLREHDQGHDNVALLDMKARYAEFAGWLYQDAGDHRTAQGWLDRALEWSHAAGDLEMATFILARKSQLAGDTLDAPSAIDLAAAAGRLARPGSRLEALAPTYAAHGYALLARRADSIRALENARALLTKLDDDGTSTWAHWLDSSYIDVQTARCLSIMGDQRHAVEMFRLAIAQLPPSYRRDRGVYMAREALAHIGNRDPDQAATVGTRALAIAHETGSGRIMNELVRLDEALAAWPTLPASVDFRDRMVQFRRPTG